MAGRAARNAPLFYFLHVSPAHEFEPKRSHPLRLEHDPTTGPRSSFASGRPAPGPAVSGIPPSVRIGVEPKAYLPANFSTLPKFS